MYRKKEGRRKSDVMECFTKMVTLFHHKYYCCGIQSRWMNVMLV